MPSKPARSICHRLISTAVPSGGQCPAESDMPWRLALSSALMASVSAPSCCPRARRPAAHHLRSWPIPMPLLTCDHLSAGMVVDTKPTAGDLPRFSALSALSRQRRSQRFRPSLSLCAFPAHVSTPLSASVFLWFRRLLRLFRQWRLPRLCRFGLFWFFRVKIFVLNALWQPQSQQLRNKRRLQSRPNVGRKCTCPVAFVLCMASRPSGLNSNTQPNDSNNCWLMTLAIVMQAGMMVF